MNNDANYVNFGDIARGKMGQQCQYASRYFCIHWNDEYPYLGKDLRITGTSAQYHDMMIHKDDIDIAVRRYFEYRNYVGVEISKTVPKIL